MRRWPEQAMAVAAVLFAAFFLLSVLGVPVRGTTRATSGARREQYFHGGKNVSAPPADPACQSSGCHDAYPHRRDRTEAVFRNMHERTSDCLSCHGKDAEQRREGRARREGEGWRIRYPAPTGGGDPHALLGRGANCRSCHSEGAMRKLREKGMSEFPPGFADPIALRMIEGGAKRWVPADLR